MEVILITGASSGFGRLTALELAREGHHVFAGMRSPEAGNRQAAEALERACRDLPTERMDVVSLDIADQRSVRSAVAYIEEKVGRLDVLVNNAAIMPVGVTEAYSESQAVELLNTNVVGVIRLARAVLPGMRQRRSGLMIHVSSLAGRVVFPFFGLYCATKFAIEALGEAFRYELSPFGVDSVIVEPGPFPTRLIANSPPPGDLGTMEAYGETAKIPAEMLHGFVSSFQQPDAPDPADVARAIAKLVRTPLGARPLRTLVGADFGVAALNDSARKVQESLLDALDLGELRRQLPVEAGHNA